MFCLLKEGEEGLTYLTLKFLVGISSGYYMFLELNSHRRIEFYNRIHFHTGFLVIL